MSLRSARSQRSEYFLNRDRVKSKSKDDRAKSKCEKVVSRKSSRDMVGSMPDTSKEKQQINRFVKRTMEKGVRGLRKEFLSMKRLEAQ
ncbi:hypothetical protein KIN20_029793 [Parelaphostrongylus tenuis]|uniref:Uncharacterized protein n=1 Tax=Parelaphostrongylus tenuis TaxID=148309 RepID=A0AAD5R312_PARTN|nr:hypothetical protein KIN20_029793 [Parelaphostrongylus tenuis]